MHKYRWLHVVAAVLALVVGPALVGTAHAGSGGKKKSSSSAGSSSSSKSSGQASKSKKGKRRGRFDGHNAGASEMRGDQPLGRPSGRVVVHNVALREDLDVNIYNPDGSFNQEVLAKLDHFFRCRSTDEERAMDPRLFETLSRIYDHYGKPVDVNSGFRYQRNEGSRHFHGSAMDVTMPTVSYYELYQFATTLDTGGMGIGKYPRGGFVHIDFRAPGEPSYRWTDSSGGNSRDSGKMPSKMWKKPNT